MCVEKWTIFKVLAKFDYLSALTNSITALMIIKLEFMQITFGIQREAETCRKSSNAKSLKPFSLVGLRKVHMNSPMEIDEERCCEK